MTNQWKGAPLPLAFLIHLIHWCTVSDGFSVGYCVANGVNSMSKHWHGHDVKFT